MTYLYQLINNNNIILGICDPNPAKIKAAADSLFNHNGTDMSLEMITHDMGVVRTTVKRLLRAWTSAIEFQIEDDLEDQGAHIDKFEITKRAKIKATERMNSMRFYNFYRLRDFSMYKLSRTHEHTPPDGLETVSGG